MNNPFQQSTFLNLVVVNSLDDLTFYKNQPNTFVPISCVENIVSELQSKIELLERSSNYYPDPFNGHAYVDLGLPSGLLWATCNIGANRPEEYGDYFAWGETEHKQTYNWDTYKFNKEEGFSKYDSDGKTELEDIDDVAHVNWGGNWRMPTTEEQDELREHCFWTWTNNYKGTGIKGRIVKSKTNGNTIFLPAAVYRDDDHLVYADSLGNYWSRSPYPFDASRAYCLYFHSGNVYTYYDYHDCYNGLSVRAVCPLAESKKEDVLSYYVHRPIEEEDDGLPF